MKMALDLLVLLIGAIFAAWLASRLFCKLLGRELAAKINTDIRERLPIYYMPFLGIGWSLGYYLFFSIKQGQLATDYKTLGIVLTTIIAIPVYAFLCNLILNKPEHAGFARTAGLIAGATLWKLLF